MRLNWLRYDPEECSPQSDSEQTRPARKPRRSLAGVGISSIPRLSSPDIEITLKKIDDWSPGSSAELERSVFSVFQAQFPREAISEGVAPSPAGLSDATGRAQDQDNRTSPGFAPEDPSLRSRKRAIEATGNRNAADESYNASLQPEEDGCDATVQLPVVSAESRSFSEQDLFPDAATVSRRFPVAHVRSEDENLEHREEAHHLGQSLRYREHQQPAPTHLDFLNSPADQKRLIHHWVTFTSRKLVLLDEPHNPCRTMMLPMALKGLVSISDGSSADIAIFHAICASAAYNLYELSGRTNEQDGALALSHDQQAIHHLRHNLARADEHQDQSFAMAIMACIAVEAVSGTTRRWRTHVSGGLAYLAKLESRGVDEAMLSAFRQHMVLMAILCGFPVPNELKSFLDDERLEGHLEFTFPYYGISRSFLKAFDRMNTLAAGASGAAGDAGTASSPSSETSVAEKELDAFELQMYLDFPRLPLQALASTRNSTSVNHSIVVHHVAKAFYYAGLVYFQCSIRKAEVDAVQVLVELGVQELEAITAAGRGEAGCMMLWPVLVLGAECDTPSVQRRLLAWFQDQRKLGFRNLVVLEELVATIWKTRSDSDRGASRVDWRDIMMLEQFDVFRL